MHRDAEVKELNQDFREPFTYMIKLVNAGRQDRRTMLCPQVSDV